MSPTAVMHQGISPPRRAFSLIEVLLAIFILGIGVISIASLFPAGIAQQRQSVDDIVGAMVADNAMSIIRGKVSEADFGTLEEFGFGSSTIPGDWGWSRPAFCKQLQVFTPGPVNLAQGSIILFRDTTLPTTITNGEIPWNSLIYGTTPPPIVIHQWERYYPMASGISATIDPPRPQYVWECMFRRFQGKVLVAIFVYRVNKLGGLDEPYYVAPNATNPDVPPLPISLNFVDATDNDVNTDVSAGGCWDAGLWGGYDQDLATYEDNASIKGLEGGVTYNPDDARHAWQDPRQWILDQNNNIHQVLGASRPDEDSDGDDDFTSDMRVDLVRAVPELPNLPLYYFRPSTPAANRGVRDCVTNIWYMPLTDANGVSITPVYCTVKEL